MEKTKTEAPPKKQRKKKRTPRGSLMDKRRAAYPCDVNDPCRVLRVKEVAVLLGLHPCTVWDWAAAGKLPKAIKISAGRSAWRARDISAWLDRKAAESNAVTSNQEVTADAR
jgi:predicted DNA-binding transcriptional regulator AlpA